MLMGFPMRECLSNGSWSQEEPVCESKSLKYGMFEQQELSCLFLQLWTVIPYLIPPMDQ